MRRQFSTAIRVAALAVAVAFAAACSDQQPIGLDELAPPDMPSPAFSTQSKDTQRTDQHLISINGKVPADLADQVANLGGTLVRTHAEIGVAIASGLTDEAAAQLAGSRRISGVDRDILVQWIPSSEEFDPQNQQGPVGETDQSGASFFPLFQWNMRQIAADQAWLASGQGLGATVAVLDTGGDPFHIDLAGKILGSSTSVLSSSPCGASDVETIFDLNFHGSFVSGLISSNGIGMASVAPDAKILIVKVLNCTGSGSFGDIITGILFAAHAGVDVINMSLAAFFPKNLPGAGPLVAALNRATNFANRNGVLVVASAGNEAVDLDKDRNFTHVPSQSANVLSVGATGPIDQTNFDQLSVFTNFGVSGVDVMAPGGNFGPGSVLQDLILSVCSSFVCPGPNFYTFSAGTSFSAPLAAGTAAVVESSIAGNQNAAKLEHCVIAGADDVGKKGTDDQYGKGRINVLGAVHAPGC